MTEHERFVSLECGEPDSAVSEPPMDTVLRLLSERFAEKRRLIEQEAFDVAAATAAAFPFSEQAMAEVQEKLSKLAVTPPPPSTHAILCDFASA